MFIVGITGSLATGKTTVARMTARLGAEVVDADEIAQRLIEPGGRCFKKVVGVFGKKILSEGRIDRPRLAEIVFKDARARKKLEKIIHPQVIREIRRAVRLGRKSNRHKIMVLDVPLLYETGLDKWADAVIVVGASQEKQIQRIKKRLGLSRSQALKRINAQMPLKLKTRRADWVIANNGRLAQTQKQLKNIWACLKKSGMS